MEDCKKEFPAGMIPLGDSDFTFECHAGLSCFTFCCKNVDLTLYPYDIIRLKKCLGIGSEEFLRSYTFLKKDRNPYFPSVKLKLVEGENNSCPFLKDDGCSVYVDRPSACRTYPLEIAVDRDRNNRSVDEFYFMTNHSYCSGHKEKKIHNVKSWIRNQRLHDYNLMNSLWAEIDTLFSTNPWKGEGVAGEKQQLAFMVCYNIDGFRSFSNGQKIIQQFAIDKDFKKRILSEDSELLKFGFQWLKLLFHGRSSLIKR